MSLRATASMASPVILSNATISPDVTGEDVALMERRRALKEGAFVRYSNADMLEKLRASPQSRSPTGSKSPMRGKKERDMASNRLTKSTNGLVIPGNLYQSRAESPNLTSPHAHLHDMPSPSRTEGTLLLRETVDGIGHASVPNLKTLRGVKPLTSLSIPPVTPDSSERLPPLTASKSIPVIELEGKVGEQVASHHPSSSPSAFHRKAYHESFNDEGLNVLLQSSHWKKNQRASKLIPLAAVHLDSSSSSAQTATVLPESAAEAIALVTQEALDVQRQKALQIKLQKEREAVEALLKNTGQKSGLLDDDSLNLWQGKRLTGAEMKVEQRLHVLRNNPAANKDLKEKVLSYIDEKHQEHQERQALAEFAVERRELKTIQFLSRRFKQSTSPKKNQAEPGGSTSPPPATSDLFNSVYDPSTGEPRMDTIPLPISSMFFWSGMTRLTQTLEALRQSMKWRQEIKHASRFKALASVIIQKHWRGYKARLTIRNLRSDVEKLRRENEQKNRMLAEGDAAQKVLAFLQHMQSVYESGRSVMQVEVSGRLSRSARSVSNRKTTADILRRIRLDIMLRQWNEVEHKVIDIAKKRIRTSAALGIDSEAVHPHVSKGHGEARSRESSFNGSSLDDGADDRVQKVVARAVASIGMMDRIVMEDFSPVPKPVKITVIHCLMRERQSAYIKLIGQYWLRKARWQKHARDRAAMSSLISIVRRRLTSDGEAPSNAPEATKGSITQTIEEGEEVEEEEEEEEELVIKKENRSSSGSIKSIDPTPARSSYSLLSQSSGKKAPSFKKAPGLNTIKEDRPQPTNAPPYPGALPRFRLFMTLPEIKAVMQLGVAETPSYKGFLLAAGEAGGNLQDMISKELLSRQRSLSTGVSDEEMSFTLALLLHRWDSECTPKLTACIRKRFEISKTDLTTALAEGLWLPPAEIAVKLMELRNG